MNIAVIPAGGAGQILAGESCPKQFLDLDGEPVIIRTVRNFERTPQIDAIVIACIRGWEGYLQEILDRSGMRKVKMIVPGGETGQLSIYNALCGARELSDNDHSVVLVHDAVRPFIDSPLIIRCIDGVEEYGSAVTVAPVHETVLVTGDDLVSIPDKARCLFARAPQCFRLDDLLSLHEQAMKDGITDFVDSCSMAYYYGRPLHFIEGPEEDIKITTRYDMYAAEGILRRMEDRYGG